MIKLYVTEGKNWDPVKFYLNSVRVFLAKDYSYGLWVDEDFLFEELDVEQKRSYLQGNSEESRNFIISKEVAKRIVLKGRSPYSKANLLTLVEKA